MSRKTENATMLVGSGCKVLELPLRLLEQFRQLRLVVDHLGAEASLVQKTKRKHSIAGDKYRLTDFPNDFPKDNKQH